MTEAYPLRWPDGWPRTPPYRRESDNRFGGRGGITTAVPVISSWTSCVGLALPKLWCRPICR
jgi:hypothetical protein